MVLFKHHQKRIEQRMKFEAALHGVSIKGEEKSTFKDPETKQEVTTSGALFKDPEEYESWSKEEREKETERLMALTKKWAKTKPLGGKKPRKGG